MLLERSHQPWLIAIIIWVIIPVAVSRWPKADKNGDLTVRNFVINCWGSVRLGGSCTYRCEGQVGPEVNKVNKARGCSSAWAVDSELRKELMEGGSPCPCYSHVFQKPWSGFCFIQHSLIFLDTYWLVKWIFL